MRKKSLNLGTVIVLAVIVLLLAGNIFQLRENVQLKKKIPAEVTYQPADESLIESGFYPGRPYGDYSDYVFSFDAYLESIGATDVAKYMYSVGDGIVFELRFKLDGNSWKLKSTEFRSDDIYSFGMYSSLEVDTGKVKFSIPAENYGTHVCDSTSPFKVDWVIFDVFHISTDKSSGLARELRAGMEETNCPFYGLGIAHSEEWPDGTVIWHDDMGEFLVSDGLDLHY